MLPGRRWCWTPPGWRRLRDLVAVLAGRAWP
jgi:hypothetical protein